MDPSAEFSLLGFIVRFSENGSVSVGLTTERWERTRLLLAGVLEGSISTAPRVLARIAGNVVSGTLFFGPGVLGRLRGLYGDIARFEQQ